MFPSKIFKEFPLDAVKFKIYSEMLLKNAKYLYKFIYTQAYI